MKTDSGRQIRSGPSEFCVLLLLFAATVFLLTGNKSAPDLISVSGCVFRSNVPFWDNSARLIKASAPTRRQQFRFSVSCVSNHADVFKCVYVYGYVSA